jgi:hypothetical protein
MARLLRALDARKRRRRFNCHDQDEASWDDRADQAVGLLAAAEAASSGARLTVADLGAGNQRLRSVLERMLAAPVDYHAYDIRPQAENVRRLDVQKALPEQRFDVVFCLGLLEYLRDLDDFVCRVGKICRYAVVSYVITDPPDALDSSARRDRGWLTDLTRSGLEDLFDRHGYTRESFAFTNAGHTGVWLWSTSGDAAVPST